jgi:hypothetical protein
MAPGGEQASYALPRGAPLVESNANADLAVSAPLAEALGGDLPQGAALEVRELEILEYDVDELLESDIRLVDVLPGTIASCIASRRSFSAREDFSGLRVPGSLGNPGSVLPIHEAILANAADGHLDDLVSVFADDGLFGDDVGDVVAYRLANLLPMTQAVTRAAIASLRLGTAEGAKDGSARHGPAQALVPAMGRSREPSIAGIAS